MRTVARHHESSRQLARQPRFTTHVAPTIGIRITRLLRAPAFVFGKLLAVVGIVAVIVSGFLGVAFTVGDEPVTTGDWLVVAAIGGGGIVAIVVGIASVRGRRHLVLFLRKFGYGDATAATSYAAERAMGRRWRLVTLDDDSATAPIGVSKGLRRRSNLLGFLGLALLVGSISFVAYWLLNDGPGELYRTMTDDALGSWDEENPDASFGDSIGAAVGIGLGVAFALVVILAYGLVVLLTVCTACVDLWITRIAVKRADRSKSWRMESEADVARVADAIGRRARRVHAPRLFVVRAADSIWKQTVRALADDADAVIIDISHPTENLLWEIREMRQRRDVNWVLVCAADGAVLHTPSEPKTSEVWSLIEGAEVLVYTTGDPHERRFARSLRNQLDRSLHRPRHAYGR